MQAPRVGSKDLIREINESIVISEIRTSPLSSRTDIADRTGLSLPTVSGITAQLLDLNLIEERDTGESTGGRRPVRLALRPQAGFAIGIKLTEDQVISVLTDLDATVVARHKVAIAAGGALPSTLDAIDRAVDALRPGVAGRPLHGVGIGLAGVVDRDHGRVRHATYSNWGDVDLAGALADRLSLPVVVDNDVNALVASEQWFGAGRGIGHFAVVSVGRGVGLGLVLDGRLYRGAHGGAGEFGHTKVAAGPACACGGSGCLEALVSDAAISAEASTVVGHAISISEAVAVADAGNRKVAQIFQRAGEVLGRATGNLVNVLNPELIVLAGEGTRAQHLILPAFRRGLDAAIFDGLQQDLRVVIDEWDDEAWARGAASLLLGELFQPQLQRTTSTTTHPLSIRAISR